jgi:signal transduction histidine kinase
LGKEIIVNTYANQTNNFASDLSPEGDSLPGFTYKQGGPARVLVVDDENGPRQALRMLLKEEYAVDMADSVANAMTVLEDKPVDVIVSDIRMPTETGLDLLRKVRTRFPDVQVIILTGYGHLDTAMKAVEYGAFAYLEKPFDNDVMLDKVRACMQRHQHEEDRRALEYLALEANRFETLGRLVSGTLHDLGTPMTVLSSHLEILMEEPEGKPLLPRLETMRSQVEHCSDLVRTTMNFLRQSPEKQSTFSMNEAVALCMEVAKPLFRRLGVVSTLSLSTNLGPSQGDVVLIRQAVLNLINNACQAMADVDGDRELEISTWRDSDKIYLSVHDTGPGVPEELRDKIFDTLYTTKGNEGTGLGLVVVRSVMHRYGGEVSLAEDSSHGAKFVLSFPATESITTSTETT